MKKRCIPFGYQISQGEIIVNPTEAEAVQMIFSLYCSGLGYQEISMHMYKVGIQYHNDAQWNKHMVKRILENQKYLGQDGWPQIIETGLFQAVTQRKAMAPNYAKLRKSQFSLSADFAPPPKFQPTPAVRRLEREIDRALERTTPADIKGLIFRCAAEKYHSLEGGAAVCKQ